MHGWWQTSARKTNPDIHLDTSSMSITLLHRLAAATLPCNIDGGSNVDAVRILVMAGHIKAIIPAPVRTLDGYVQPIATVTAVTPMGQTMLKRFVPPGSRKP